MRKILIPIIALAIIILIIIGLINFDLMVEIWVKLFIGVLLVGVVLFIWERLVHGK
jgi:maltodextrin utilization protein YvdJ